jgi:hypothetical protein
MPDKVPIGTHPGSVSGLLNQDLIVAPAATAQYTVERVWLRRTDDTTDALVASIRNATAGGGDGLACTIADAAESGVSSAAAITVDIGESLYLRVTSANALSQNLSGWFETEVTTGVVTALTTLARVKRFWSIGVTTNDVLLNELIAAVSGEIQAWLGRRILQTTATAEKPAAPLGDHILQLDNRPVISITSVSEAGTALVDGTDFECVEMDKKCGQVIRLSGGYPYPWNSALRRISVTYEHGYATVPEEIAQAATELVLFDYLQSTPGGPRHALRASVHDPGGSGDYLTRDECWRAQLHRLSPHRRM